MFLSGLLMQIMVTEKSFIWLKINLSSLPSAVLLCVRVNSVHGNLTKSGKPPPLPKGGLHKVLGGSRVKLYMREYL